VYIYDAIYIFNVNYIYIYLMSIIVDFSQNINARIMLTTKFNLVNKRIDNS